MLQHEILESIDVIANTKNDSENAVMEALLSCYEKQSVVIEECLEDFYKFSIFNDTTTNIVQESAKKKNKKSLIETIWNSIKKFIGMILSGIKKFITNLTNKSTSDKAKPTESVSSIAARVLEKNAKKNKPDNIDQWPVPKVNPKYIVEANNDDKDEVIKESYEQTMNVSSAPDTVTIPYDPKSKIKGETVKLRSDGITTSMSDDKKTIKVRYFGFGKGSVTKMKEPGNDKYDIPGQDKEWYSSPKVALHLITHDSTRKDITDLIELALRVMKKRDKKDIAALNDEGKISKLVKIFVKPESHTYEITFDQLTSVQAWASDLLVKMEAFTSSDVDIHEFDKKTIKSLNMVVRLLMRIQISLNYLSSAMGNLYIIDKAFYKSIKSLAILDEFVDGCIKAGLPPKYVAFNAWLISDECIRGNGKYKPLFGHARATIFPPNEKIVLKIALSGLGVVSNETEVRFTKIFVDMDRIDLIAPVLKEFKTNSIVAMERVKGNFDLSSATCKEFAKKADEALTEYQKKTGKKLNIKMGSQHVGNVAFDYKYKVYRSIDYGVHYRNS